MSGCQWKRSKRLNINIINWNISISHTYVYSREASFIDPISYELLVQCKHSVFTRCLTGTRCLQKANVYTQHSSYCGETLQFGKSWSDISARYSCSKATLIRQMKSKCAIVGSPKCETLVVQNCLKINEKKNPSSSSSLAVPTKFFLLSPFVLLLRSKRFAHQLIEDFLIAPYPQVHGSPSLSFSLARSFLLFLLVSPLLTSMTRLEAGTIFISAHVASPF